MIQDFKDIDTLSPSDFEIFVRDLFVEAGWTDAVITTVGKEYRHGDGGVDIFAYKNKRKFAIEVKQRSVGTTVDVGALNQLVTGAKLANVNQMILVTNSYFTSEVKVRALRLGVELFDRDALQNFWVKKQCEIGREIKPRTYQHEVINTCVQQYAEGKTRFLVEMATGLGKTYTVAHIIKRIVSAERQKRVLFLAHQIEILLQSVTAFKNVLGIGTYSYSACFNGSDPEDTDFVFASFDTLYAKLSALSNVAFDIVIVDEAHHTPARTYAEVVQYFQPKLLIGLTATPQRADSQNVMTFFGGSDGHIGKYDLAWGLRHNKLAFPKYEVLLDDLSQERLSQLRQGLTVTDIDQRLFLHRKDQEVVAIIEKTVASKQIKNVKGIVFCRSIQHMRHLIQFFPMGSATLVHSHMSDMERRNNIRNFREGAFKYILVCDLFNEGVDIPETNLLVFMRATGSRTVWLQQLGRGLRKTPNKDYVHVLDFVGSLDRLNDVRKLQQAVRKIPINRDDWEPEPRAERNIVYDSTLEVSYSQSAAQVLKLIEDLEYRLASRDRLVAQLRDYVKDHGRLPSIEELEVALPNITCDQVATFFDSYYRYVIAAVPSYADDNTARKHLSAHIEDYARKFGIAPSVKAISNAFKHKSLEAYADEDVIHLIGDIDQMAEKCLEPEGITTLNAASPSEAPISDSNDERYARRMYLIKKHLGAVATVHDLRALSAQDRGEIRHAFQSDFYFLKVLSEASQR